MTYAVPTLVSAPATQFVLDQWNFSKMAGDMLSWYGSAIGPGMFGMSFFGCMVMLVLLGGCAIRQKSILIPSAILLIISCTSQLYGFVPSSMQPFFIVAFGVFPAVSIIYSLFKER